MQLNIDCDLLKNKNVIIALSGGIDSVVLLHFMVNNIVKNRIKAIHINHNTAKNANEWADFSKNLCTSYAVDYKCINIHIDNNKNFEKVARDKRYTALLSGLGINDILCTAHHIDDQVETLLLQLFRGCGVAGLAAMPELKNISNKQIYRPFLTITKEQIKDYATYHNLHWIEDDSNNNTNFRRNFLRLEVLPLLKKHYPNINKSINRAAKHQAQALLLLSELASQDISEYKLLNDDDNLIITRLKKLSVAKITNVLRYYFKYKNIIAPNAKILQQIITKALNAKPDAKVLITWGEYRLRCYRDIIYILTTEKPPICNLTSKFADMPNVEVRYKTSNIRCILANKQHSQELKKILQDKKIPPWQRDKLAMYYLDDKLVAIQGVGEITQKKPLH